MRCNSHYNMEEAIECMTYGPCSKTEEKVSDEMKYPIDFVYVVTGWDEYGDVVTDGFVYTSRSEAQEAAKKVTFGSYDTGVEAPGNVKSVQGLIWDIS